MKEIPHVKEERKVIRFPDDSSAKLVLFSTDEIGYDSPVVIIIPALGVGAYYYEEFARYLARERAWIVALTEHRGMGSSSERPNKSEWGYYTIISVELPTYLETVIDIYPSNQIFLLGHSLGGKLNVLFLSYLLQTSNTMLYEKITGTIQVASPNLYYQVYGFQILILTAFIYFYCLLFGYYDGKWFGFGGCQSKDMMYDWASIVITGKWKLRGCPYDLDEGLKTVDKPLLFVTLGNDYYAPPRTVEALAGKCGGKTKVMCLSKEQLGKEYEAFTDKLMHFRWAKYPAKLTDQIHDWIKQDAK